MCFTPWSLRARIAISARESWGAPSLVREREYFSRPAPLGELPSLSMADILCLRMRYGTKAKGAFPPLQSQPLPRKTGLSPSGQRLSNKYEHQIHGYSPLVRRKIRKD